MRWFISLGLVLLGCQSAPDSTAGNPFASNALSKGERYRFDAVVERRLRAGSYTYLLVRDTAGVERWVATLAATSPKGPSVSVWVMARAESFHSKLLDRDFDPLLFAAVQHRTAEDPPDALIALERNP